MIRKLAAVDSIAGLGVESAYLFLPALAMLAVERDARAGRLLRRLRASAMSVLLIVSGALTALPLVGFAYAVRRVPLSIIGLLQYVAPTMQFLIGVFVFHEAFDRDRAVGFAFIWIALAIFAIDGALRARRANARATLVPAASPAEVRHAPDAPQLRMLRQGPAARRARRADLFLRMHVLRGLRRPSVLKGRCPNCGGTFAPRPRRAAHLLVKYPASTERVLKPNGCAA